MSKLVPDDDLPMGLTAVPDDDLPGGITTSPQSRWQAIQKQARETLSDEIKKSPTYREYEEYLKLHKMGQKAGPMYKPGDIPGTSYEKDPMSFGEWQQGRGDLGAWVGRGIGTGVDTALALGAGLWDAGPGLIKGVLSGKSAEESMRDPSYIPKTDAGEWVLQKLGEALPNMPTVNIPSKARTAKQLAERQQKDFGKKLDTIAPKPVESAKLVPAEDLPSTQLELPLATSPEAIAEMRGRGTGQPDLFFSEQANAAARATQSAEALARQALDAEASAARAAEMAARARRTNEGAQMELFDQPEQGRTASPHEAMAGDWRIDENGMPVKVDLSMDAANVQDPLQRNLWGDELDPRSNPRGQAAGLPMDRDIPGFPQMTQDLGQQMGVPLSQAIDNMPWIDRRAAVKQNWAKGSLDPEGPLMGALAAAERENMASGIGPGRAGPGRGISRGAIDLSKLMPDLTGNLDSKKQTIEQFARSLRGSVKEQADRTRLLVQKLSETGQYQWNIGDVVYSPKTGRSMTILGRTAQRDGTPMYYYEAGKEGEEGWARGTLYAEKAHGSLVPLNRGGVGVGGPRGAQRGAIDVRGVRQALDDLKKGIIKGPDALRAFVGTFDPQMDHKDISKGIGGGHIGWFPAIKDSRDLKSEGRLVWMSPQDFHTAALPRFMDSTKKGGIGENKRGSIRTGIHDPGGLSSLPVLRLNEMGKIIGHEGRHRMDVMKELGISKAPVYLYTNGHTNADGPIKHLSMISEDGTKKVAVPETIFPMGNEPLSFAPRTEVGQSGIGRGGLTRGGMSFHSKQNKRTEIIQDVLKTEQRAPLPKPEAIVESALADGKDGKGSVWFAAGATLEALKRRSPLIQGVSRVVQHYKNVADSSIRESVFPFEDSVRKLSRTEVEQISKVLKAEMFNRQRFDMAKLAELGLSEKQLLAYSRIREMHGKALEAQNKARAAKGLKPITELDAYLSSRWQGDFRRVFKDKDGNVVWALADNTKRGLETQTASLLKEVPGLTHVDHTVKSARGWRPDYTQVYQTMIDVLGDDPAAAKAKSWYESQVMAAASETRAQEKHFKPKGNIRGFIGDRPGKAGFQESLDMLQQQINYAKNAHKWAAMQEAGLHLKDVLSSKELADAQPNNLRYAREYFADNIGANELAWVKAMEDGIRDLGISPNTIGSGVGTLKAIWVGQKLAANAGFLASNVIQSVNMLPTLAHMQVTYGGNPITSIPSGMLLGTAMAVSHVMGGKGTAVYKGLGQVPGLPTEFIARAMKFAEDNSVIAKSVYDESPIGSSFGIGGLTNKVASKTISLPETLLRSIAYMTYVSQLKSSGKFKSDLDLFRVADEHVRASMGDYGEGERAMAFNKLGNIGNAANVLQTFPINYFNQWSWVSREAAKGNVAPFVTMFAVQASVAGAMGVPGFADADKVLEWLKDYVRDTFPKMWSKIKDFSLKEMVIKLGGESALYGPLSTQSGVALTSRAAAPAATEMAVVPGAPWADAAKQLGSVASAVTDPLNPQKRAQALFDIAPAGLQGYLETGPFKEFTSVTRPDGSTVYGKPSKMAAREGVYARTPEEETLRSFGFRSQKEAATKDALYRARKGEADVKAVVAKLPDKVWNELRLGRKDKAKELFQLHVELTGRGMSKQAITEQLKKEYMTQAEQMIARKNLPLEGLLAYKRFQDMMKEMGYEN